MTSAKMRTLLLYIPAVSMYTVVCGAISLLLATVFRSGEPSHRVARFWARLILRTCGIGVSVAGLERLQGGAIYVFASNHQSLFDIPILFANLPHSFRILYKESLNFIPFLGWHLFMSGHIAVDRSNPMRARRSIDRAAARIRGGTSVVVFPEGTRSYDGAIGRFKKGSFHLALRAGVPIVPVTIVDSWRIMRRGEVTVHPASVHVTVDDPIPVTGYDEQRVEELSVRVREVVSANYARESKGGAERAASPSMRSSEPGPAVSGGGLTAVVSWGSARKPRASFPCGLRPRGRGPCAR